MVFVADCTLYAGQKFIQSRSRFSAKQDEPWFVFDSNMNSSLSRFGLHHLTVEQLNAGAVSAECVCLLQGAEQADSSLVLSQ